MQIKDVTDMSELEAQILMSTRRLSRSKHRLEAEERGGGDVWVKEPLKQPHTIQNAIPKADYRKENTTGHNRETLRDVHHSTGSHRGKLGCGNTRGQTLT